MSTLSFPATGRTLTLINRTSRVLGVAGTTIGPNGTKTISLRKVHGHPTYMSTMEALIRTGSLQVQLTQDVLSATDMGQLDAPLSGDLWLARDIFTNPATADVDAIKASFTAPAADTAYSGSDLDGAIGAGDLDFARNITIKGTCGVGEALDGGDAIVTGTDADGQAMTEVITLSAVVASANATDEGAYAFKTVTSVMIPADASGSPGAYEIGFGNKFGLSKPLSQGGLLQETTDNAIPGTGATVVLSATALPNGTVAFNTDPNGVHDYIVYYIPG